MPVALRTQPVAAMRRPMHLTAGALPAYMSSGVQLPDLFPTTPGCPAGHQGKMVMKCCPPMTKLTQVPFSKEWVCVASGFGAPSKSGRDESITRSPTATLLVGGVLGAVALVGAYFIVTGLRS